jgi:hypothetical protein
VRFGAEGVAVRRHSQPLGFSAEDTHLDETGGYLHAGAFRFRRRGRRISARWVTNSRYRVPPYFLGQIEKEDRPVVVTGTIHEARGETAWTTVYGFAAWLMAAVSVLAGLNQVWIGLGICLPAALIFGFMWHRFRADRRQRFPVEAAELEQSVRSYVATGDPGRYPH